MHVTVKTSVSPSKTLIHYTRYIRQLKETFYRPKPLLQIQSNNTNIFGYQNVEKFKKKIARKNTVTSTLD